MEKLNRPLNQVLRKWGLRQHVNERMALYVWPEAAGSKLSSCTRAAAVKEGILFVQVPNSSWAQHLTFFKGTLLKKINRCCRETSSKIFTFSGRGGGE
jgi:predicted nucleic acid-binding Zn ribbon protein